MQNSVNNFIRQLFFFLTVASVFTPLVFNRQLYEGFSAPKGIYFQIVVELMLVCWAILAFRSPDFRPKWTWQTIATLSFIAILLLADVVGVDNSRSFWSSFDRMEGFILYVHLVGYFFSVSSILKDEKNWGILAAISCLVAFYVAWQGMKNPDLAEYGRTFSTIGSASFVSIYLLFHFFVCPLLFLRFLGAKKRSKILQISTFLLAIILEYFYVAVILKTQTRAATLGLFGSIIVLLLLLAIYFWQNRVIKIASGLISVLIIVAVFVIYRQRNAYFIQHNSILFRLTKFSKNDSSIQTRLANWKMAWAAFKEKPLLGWGQENYHYVFAKYYNPSLVIENSWFDRPHNFLFDWLVSGGILLFLAYLSLLAAAFYVLKKFSVMDKIFLMSAFAAYFVWAFFSIDSVSNLFIIFLIFAYIQSKSTESAWLSNKFSFLSLQHSSSKLRNLLAFLSVILLFFLLKSVPLKTYQTLKDLTNAMNASDLETMMASFRKTYDEAIVGQQDVAEEFVARSGVVDASNISPEMKLAYYSAASKLMSEENDRHYDYVRLMNLYGITLLGSNKVAEAVGVYEKAKKISPKYQISLMQLGLSYLRKNDFQHALQTFEEAYQVNKSYERPLLFKARTYAFMDDTANVQKTIERISDKEIYTNILFVKEIYAIENKLVDFLQIFYLLPKRHMEGYGRKLFLVWATTAFDLGKMDYAVGGLRSYDRYFPYQVEGQEAFVNNLVDEMIKNHKRPDDLVKIFPPN